MKIRNYIECSLILATSIGITSCSSMPSFSQNSFSQILPSQAKLAGIVPAQVSSGSQLTPSKWLPSQQSTTDDTYKAQVKSVAKEAVTGYLQPQASSRKSYKIVAPVKIPGRLSTQHKVPNNAERYYVVVGTYDTQEKAMDQFIRLSSIGLTKTTMETRVKGSRTLHMVRLGPFIYQDEIDNVKDRLRSDGLSNFTVVKN